MPFDKDQFISQATAGGMAEKQAEFLADQIGMRAVGQADLVAIENRLRGELTNELDGLRSDMDTKSVLTRVQIDDLTAKFARMEARIEGTLKSSFVALRRAHYASSAFHTLTTLSVVILLLWWLG